MMTEKRVSRIDLHHHPLPPSPPSWPIAPLFQAPTSIVSALKSITLQKLVKRFHQEKKFKK
jgi:hypothetical protein